MSGRYALMIYTRSEVTCPDAIQVSASLQICLHRPCHSRPNAKAPIPAAKAIFLGPSDAIAPLSVAVAVVAVVEGVGIPYKKVKLLPVRVPPVCLIVPLIEFVPGDPKHPVKGPIPPQITPLLTIAVAPNSETVSCRFACSA